MSSKIVDSKSDESSNTITSELSRIIGPSVGWIGVIIAWCLQTGYGTPYLLELGLNESNVNYVYLAGPITGMIKQPIIGALSDKIKQRRPFIIIGAITVFFTLISFSNAKWINVIQKHYNYALIIAIILFWINDLCINVLMVPLRALASDTISTDLQINAMAWFSIFAGIGSLISFGLGSITSNVSILYFIGAIIVILTCSVTLKIVKNELKFQSESDHITLCGDGIRNIFAGIYKCPWFLWKLMIVQFFTFAAFFPLWVYGTHFYGENMMNVDVNEDYKLYQKGVRYGNLGFFLSGIVNLIMSIIIPRIFSCDDHKKIKVFWSISYILFAVFLCMTPWIEGRKYIVIFIICQSISQGLALSSMHIFGWMYVSIYAIKYEKENKGLVLTIYNVSMCVPQIVMALICGSIIEHFDHNVASILFIGGILAFLAAISVCFVDGEYKENLRYNQLDQQDIEMVIENNDGIYK